MPTPATKPRHIEVTELMVRLYTLLTQVMDRAVNDEIRKGFPEQEFFSQLNATQAETLEALSINRVVHDKVQKQCERARALAGAVQKGDATAKAAAIQDLQAERAELYSRTIAMTDLLAIFRST